MADKFVSQSNLSYFWSQVKTKLAGKVDTTDSRLTDSRTPTSHTHGNISNSGAVTATAAIASGDRLLIADSTSSVYGIVGSTLTFGSSTTTYLRNDGTWGTPPDTNTDTHWASSTIVNSTATATSTTTTALTNGNVYLNHIENGSVKSSHKITGSGATTVTTDTSGNIIITSTDNNTVYTHPSYTAHAAGLYKVTVDALGHVSAVTAVAKSDITALGIPAQDTDTHYTSLNVVNSTNTATSTTTTALTNGNVYLNHVENGAVVSSHKISGSGATVVTTDASGNILITSTDTDTNTTYSPGTGLSLSGTTFNHASSITAGTASGGSGTIAFGGTFSIPSITYNATGHITGVSTTTIKLPANPNTDTLMTQTLSTTNSAYPVLLSSATTTGTRTGIFGTGVTINPSTKTVTASIFSGALSGNATTATTAAACSGNSATATKLATARTFTLSGNTTGSVSFDGSGNVTITTTTSSIGSATVGSASTPIYLNAGVPTACTIASGGLSTADRVSGTVVTVASLPTT